MLVIDNILIIKDINIIETLINNKILISIIIFIIFKIIIIIIVLISIIYTYNNTLSFYKLIFYI